MKTMRDVKVNAWIPKEVVQLWKMGGGLLEKSFGDFQTCLLDDLRACLESIEADVDFASKYETYEQYQAHLEAKSAMSSKAIEETLAVLRPEKKLERGHELPNAGIDNQKLEIAWKILVT